MVFAPCGLPDFCVTRSGPPSSYGYTPRFGPRSRLELGQAGHSSHLFSEFAVVFAGQNDLLRPHEPFWQEKAGPLGGGRRVTSGCSRYFCSSFHWWPESSTNVCVTADPPLGPVLHMVVRTIHPPGTLSRAETANSSLRKSSKRSHIGTPSSISVRDPFARERITHGGQVSTSLDLSRGEKTPPYGGATGLPDGVDGELAAGGVAPVFTKDDANLPFSEVSAHLLLRPRKPLLRLLRLREIDLEEADAADSRASF